MNLDGEIGGGSRGLDGKYRCMKTAMAVAAHPDDIEFLMSGTLILLGEAGYELHYMNVGTGNCGTAALDRDEIVAIRADEARRACDLIGAVWHPPIAEDIEILYETPLIRKLCAVVREVAPEILLLPSPQDYMEDHTTTSRLMVTAAFCRNMRNYASDPPRAPIGVQMGVYHALPYGLADQLRNRVVPDFYVDISAVMPRKREMLACHKSQKDWLDESQGVGSYIKTMEDMCAEVGRMSGRFQFAEGWRRHSHLGFGPESFDPLRDALVCWPSS
ncbi:MAG: PIG-L deacetylase family protein [Armatimonadota bacterium]